MARAHGARAQMAAAFESVYGTSPAAGTYRKMPFASATLGSDQPLLASELLGYGRDPLIPVRDAITTDGNVVVPIDARFTGFWLKALFDEATSTASAATGTITFAANPSDGDTITLNGTVWTFVAATPTGNETLIAGTTIGTIDQLVTDLNGSAETEIVKATYSRVTGTQALTITYDTTGTAGNDWTIAASVATVSDASLGGGGTSHEYRSGKWTLPSMSIEIGNPDVPSYRMFSGVVADSINWQMQRSGLVTATVECVAQKETPATASVAGTLDEMELLRFGSFNGCIHRDGVEIGNVVSGTITYSNNLDRVETICNDGSIDGADPSIAMMSGDIVVRFADTTLLDQATSGAPIELDFFYEMISGENLHVVAHAVYLPKPRISIDGPQGVQVTFAWQAARDAVTGRMCTVTLVNDVTTYDNPTP